MIVCIGDSITAGQHLPADKEPWPSFLPNVIAKGVPGDTTRLGLERFPRDVQVSGAEVVVIQFGHNDANRWVTDRGLPRVSLPAFIANLEEMVQRVMAFDAKPVLCSITVSHRSEQHADDCAEYDQALRRLARRMRVRLADVRAAINASHLFDGLHLNPEGHEVYAATVAEMVP